MRSTRLLLPLLAFSCLVVLVLGVAACGPLPCSSQSECPASLFCDLQQRACFPNLGPCRAGSTRPCFSGDKALVGKGVCKEGTQTCSDTQKWGDCLSEIVPTAETCDGKDNNCDGQVDEDCSSCAGGCPKGQRCCGDACVNVFERVDHCGGCGKVCSGNQLCCLGNCSSTNNYLNCGACGVVCKSGSSCCDGKCVNTKSDAQHCGLCGNSCPRPGFCMAGSCSLCPPPLRICSGTADVCVDTQTASRHCGRCGNSCGAGLCRDGKCVACRSSYDCDARELCRLEQQCVLDEQNTLNPNQISGSIHSWDFAVGAQGAYFLGVTFSGKLHYGDRVLISRGGTDAFVAKLDPIQDKVAWIHHVGGPGDDSITKVKLDQSNNPTFVGLYSGKALLWESGPGSPLQVSVPKGSTNGVFVLSLLSQGVLHWARALGGGTKHEAPLVAVLSKTGTSALAYTATGLASTKQIPCGAKNLYNGQDALSAGVQTVVIQLDSKGDCAWARVIGGGPGEAVSTTDLSFLTGLGTVQSLQLFGSFAGKLTWGATTLQSVGGKDAFWLQFDSKGAPERSLLKQLGSKGDDVLEHSHQTRTIWDPKQGQFGNTLMIGSFRGPVTLGTTNLTHKGQRDAFLLEMSRDSPVWSMVFGGAGDERGAFLLRDRSTSRLFMAITFQEDLRLPNGVLLRSRGKRDIALIELDRTERKVLWSAQLGGEEDEVPVAFRLTQNQGEIVLGFQTASRDLYIERQLFKTNAVGGSRALMWRVRP